MDPLNVEIIARVVALDPQGRVLLTQRAGRDYWVPPGGHVDPGESLPAAARREVAEEAHLPVEIGPFLYLWALRRGDRSRLECAFLGRVGDTGSASGPDLGPVGGLRHRRLVPPDALTTLKVFPAALATPGYRALLSRWQRASGAVRDHYLGIEGATDLRLPHRLNVRVIVAHQERLLLVSDSREQFWVLPGGLVEPDETLEQAATRETLEETGLVVAPERLIYLREFVDDHLREHGIECYFLARGGGRVRLRADPGFRDISSVRGAVTRARWFPREELRNVIVYPEALRDRLWMDLTLPGPDRFLGRRGWVTT